MKIVVNGRKHNVVDLKILYDTVSYSNTFYYFIYLKYEGEIINEWVVIDVYRDSAAAIHRYLYLKENINSDLVIEG